MSIHAQEQPSFLPVSRSRARATSRPLARTAFAVIGALALVVSTVTPAHAADPAAHVASLVEAAVAEVGAEPAAVDEPIPASVDVVAPRSITDDLSVTPTDGRGVQLVIGLPSEISAAAPTVAGDGTIVYLGAPGSASLTVEPLAEGVRVATVLTDDSQSMRYSYAMEENVRAEARADGSIALRWEGEIETADGAVAVDAVFGAFSPAWAVDANGEAVATRYELDEGRVTQLLEPDADTVYPVVADPQYIRDSAFQFRVRWNRAETATIAAGGWGATGLTAVCIAAGTAVGAVVGAAILGVVCLGISSSAVYTAGVAQHSSPRRCLQLRVRVGNVYGTSFQTFTGGSCR